MKPISATGVLAGLLAATTTWTAAQAAEIRIGATMRMISENGQKYGQMMKDEFDAINAAGGINGNKIKLTLLNDECKSDKGVANANKFAHQEKVHLIIGSTCSSVSLPIVDVTAQAKVPLPPPSSSTTLWTITSPLSSRPASCRKRRAKIMAATPAFMSQTPRPYMSPPSICPLQGS